LVVFYAVLMGVIVRVSSSLIARVQWAVWGPLEHALLNNLELASEHHAAAPLGGLTPLQAWSTAGFLLAVGLCAWTAWAEAPSAAQASGSAAGAQAPASWDPLDFLKDEAASVGERRRSVEIRHGHLSMLANVRLAGQSPRAASPRPGDDRSSCSTESGEPQSESTDSCASEAGSEPELPSLPPARSCTTDSAGEDSDWAVRDAFSRLPPQAARSDLASQEPGQHASSESQARAESVGIAQPRSSLGLDQEQPLFSGPEASPGEVKKLRPSEGCVGAEEGAAPGEARLGAQVPLLAEAPGEERRERGEAPPAAQPVEAGGPGQERPRGAVWPGHRLPRGSLWSACPMDDDLPPLELGPHGLPTPVMPMGRAKFSPRGPAPPASPMGLPVPLSLADAVLPVASRRADARQPSQSSSTSRQALPALATHSTGCRGSRAPRDPAFDTPHRSSRDVTMQDVMHSLHSVDQEQVVIVRRIKQLGFGSASTLRRHFEQFGRVSRVLVSHSHLQSRVRPASLGFVVMASCRAAEAALAAGAEQVVQGNTISVGPYRRPERKGPTEMGSAAAAGRGDAPRSEAPLAEPGA